MFIDIYNDYPGYTKPLFMSIRVLTTEFKTTILRLDTYGHKSLIDYLDSGDDFLTSVKKVTT